MQERIFISPKEFSNIAGVPLETVRKWLRDGKLKGTRMGKHWLIPKTETDRLLNMATGGIISEPKKDVAPQTNVPIEDNEDDIDDALNPNKKTKTLKEVLQNKASSSNQEDIFDEEEEYGPPAYAEAVAEYKRNMHKGILAQKRKAHRASYFKSHPKNSQEEDIDRDFDFYMNEELEEIA